MEITFLGTGTSQGIPVIACTCETCLSKDSRDQRLRVALKIQINNTVIVIDAGPDFRQQMLSSKTENLDALLITHEHNDHIAGLDDIRPFNFKHKKSIPVFTTGRVHELLKERFPYIFSSNYPGIPQIQPKTITLDKSFLIQDIPVTPIEIIHGKLPILGFRIGKMAYLTDFKSISASEKEKLAELDLLILSALHHKSHHSHSNLKESIAFAQEVAATKTLFTHMSHHMGPHEATSKLLPDSIQLAFDGLNVVI